MATLTPAPIPLVGIAGWQDSGKTTWIEHVLRDPALAGYRIGVLKHCHHPLTVKPDTDSDRYRAAGALVVLPWVIPDSLLDPAAADGALAAALQTMPTDSLDLVLVEGFKAARHPKWWLPAGSAPPPELPGPWLAHPSQGGYGEHLLEELWSSRRLNGGILVGGSSRRMGLPKENLALPDGSSISSKLKQIVSFLATNPVLIGGGDPQSDGSLPDPPGIRGPLAGLIAAQSADPHSAWLLLGCDFPLMSQAALEWLLAERGPDHWAVVPTLEGVLQPVAAIYEPPSRHTVRESHQAGFTRLIEVVQRIPQLHTPEVPGHLVEAFQSANTPEEWEALTGEPPRRAAEE